MVETPTALDQLSALSLRELLQTLDACRNPPYSVSCRQLELVAHMAGGQNLTGCFVRLEYKQNKGYLLMCNTDHERANVPLELSYVDIDSIHAISVKNSRPLLRHLSGGQVDDLPDHVPGMLELRRNLATARRAISAVLGLSDELEWLIPELECESDLHARSLVDAQIKECRTALEQLAKDDFAKQTIRGSVKKIVIAHSAEPPHVELKTERLVIYLDLEKNGRGRLHYARLANEINAVL